jgi:hypothetical protein
MSSNEGTLEANIVLNVDGRAQTMAELDTMRISLTEVRHLTMDFLYLARTMGLEGPVLEMISKINHLIMAINHLRVSILMLEAASGPVGWAFAAIGLAQAGVYGLMTLSNETDRRVR